MKTAVKHFEEVTGIKFDDLPEGKQTISVTLAIQLMESYTKIKVRGISWKEWKEWKH